MAARKSPAEGRKGDKLWSDAIRIAVNEPHEKGKKKLRALADKLVTRALDGDVAAMKEIGDRLDGKAIQPNEHGGTGGGPIKIVVETGVNRTDAG